MTQEEFAHAFLLPGLLFVYPEDAPELEPAADLNPKFHLLTLTVESAAIFRYLNRVSFLDKRPGNPYPHLISIGRSTKNDLVVAVETVSKVHGYFVRDEASWSFTDHSSTNGSRLNDRALHAGKKYLLRDHDVLRLGLQVCLEFLSPASLWDKLRQG